MEIDMQLLQHWGYKLTIADLEKAALKMKKIMGEE
jgi:hypothetical protein